MSAPGGVGGGGSAGGGLRRPRGGGQGDGDLGINGAARSGTWTLRSGPRRGMCAGIRGARLSSSASRGWRRISSGSYPVTRGDPESPLRWTSKSGAKLAEALREMGHDVVERTVLRLLKAKGCLQANKKTREGSQHPDRDAQFQHISETVSEALAAGEPVISVDAKKRELVGDSRRSAASLSRRVARSRFAATTSRTSDSGTRSPTAFTTWPQTRDG